MKNTQKFRLGVVVATRAIHSAFDTTPEGMLFLLDCLRRHVTGDWGTLDPHDQALNDRAANDAAIDDGERVFSAYDVPDELQDDSHPNRRIWVITSTEAWGDDPIRATTILWPDEY